MLSILAEKTDRRVLRTRQALHLAFATLFEETHDFERMTVQDIAERAGVNRATFYAHFEDKYALLDDFISRAFYARLEASLPPGHAGVIGLHRLVQITCEFLDEMLISCGPHRQAQHSALIMRQIQACVKQVVRNDLGLKQPANELDVTFRSWAVFGAAFDWTQNPHRSTAQALADDVVAFIKRGTTDEGAHCAG